MGFSIFGEVLKYTLTVVCNYESKTTIRPCTVKCLDIHTVVLIFKRDNILVKNIKQWHITTS